MKRYFTAIAFLVFCFASTIKANAQCPASAPIISGPITVCLGSTTYYSVQINDPGNYTWVVTGGGTLPSYTANARNVSIAWNTLGTWHIQIPYSGCANPPTNLLTVTVVSSAAIPMPTQITGARLVCTGSSTAYSVPAVAGLTPVWYAYSTNLFGSNSPTLLTAGNQVTVNWNIPGGYLLLASYSNGTCSGSQQAIYINSTTGTAPVLITGNGTDKFCVNQSFTFTANGDIADSFNWTLSGGGTITPGGTPLGKTATVLWNSQSSPTFTLTLNASNSCAGLRSTSKTITVGPQPVTPGTITKQNTTTCSNSIQRFSITTISGATSYRWRLAYGTTNVDVTTTSPYLDTNFNYYKGTGTINVTASNGYCESLPSAALNFGIGYEPLQINYPAIICEGVTTQLSVTSNNNLAGLSFAWNVGDATIIGPTDGSTINVRWNTSGRKYPSVTTITSCGYTSGAIGPNTYILVQDSAFDFSVSGMSQACLGSDKYYWVSDQAGLTPTWSVVLQGGGQANASIGSNDYNYGGNAGGSVSINFAAPGNYTLTGSATNSCGTTRTSSFNISIINATKPTASLINNVSSEMICSPSSQNYSVNNTAGVSYLWELTPSDINTLASSSNTAIVTYNQLVPSFSRLSVTPYTALCTGEKINLYTDVSPKLSLGALSKTICSGEGVNYNFTTLGLPTETMLSWPDPDGIGSGTSKANHYISSIEINDALFNYTYTPTTIIYQITPTVRGCAGIPFNLSVTVNPQPAMTSSPFAGTICSGTPMNFQLTSNIPSTFHWHGHSDGHVGGVGEQNTSIINDILINNSYLNKNVTYDAVPISFDGCTGSPQQVAVIVKPNEVISGPYGDPFTKTYGGVAFNLYTTVPSGLPISYASSNLSVASIVGSTVTITGAGTTIITAFQAGNTTLCETSKSFTLTVNKAVLTATANVSKNYGTANSQLTISYSGFVNGDNASVIDTPPIATANATGSSNVGSYPITITGGSDNNYTFSNGTGTLTISKASLSATSNATRIYGSANPVLAISYAGFINGETSSVIDSPPSVTTSVGQSTNVGNYPISLSGGLDNNYLINLTAGNFAITQAPLTATANNAFKYFGQPNPSFSVAYSGFVNGENSSVIDVLPVTSTTATTSSSAGSYPITISGGVDNNYSIAHVNGTLIVEQPSCSVSITTSGDLCTQGRVLLRTSVSGGTVSSYSWSTGENAFRIYAYWGDYYTVTVNFTNGCTATQTIYVAPVYGSNCLYYLLAAPEPEPIILNTSIFPNPADSELSIELPDEFLSQFTENIPITMIDQIGKIAFNSSFEKGQKRIRIDTRELTSGLYFLQLGSKSTGLLRQKIMIVHKN